MLYSLLKIYVRFAMQFFCYSIHVNKPELLKYKGPLLIASNHPNSFLDAIVYDILFKMPIWSLARGDVFKIKWAPPILHSLKIFPVYRTREGVENLSDNYKTFEACIEIFKKNGIVTIFSEGLCVNEWHLRPLKKGTARLAFKAWEEKIPLQVLPIGINYSSFRRFGKKIDVNIGNIIHASEFNLHDTDGNKYLAFNKKLENELKGLVYEIKSGGNKVFDEKFKIKNNTRQEILLYFPSLLGVFFHAPFYLPAKERIRHLLKDNDHYDSIMFAVFLFLYPLYVSLLFIILWLVSKSLWSLCVFLILPITAFTYVKRKVRKDKEFLN